VRSPSQIRGHLARGIFRGAHIDILCKFSDRIGRKLLGRIRENAHVPAATK
jgi:hypothetical protein